MKPLVSVLWFYVLCLFTEETRCRCTTSFITTCEKISDVSRYGQQTWQNLIIANKKSSSVPDEILTAEAFINIPDVEELYIVKKLTDVQPLAFANLNKLISLKFYQNNLKVLKRGAFSNINQLSKLDLSQNGIENLVHGLFENSTIDAMDFSKNKLTNIQVDMLSMPDLKKLSLADNDISWLTPGCFHEDLEVLNLRNNKLAVVQKEVLEPLQNLKELILSHNSLRFVPNSYSLEALEILDLSNNNIEGIEADAFKSFLELRTLSLAYNKLTYFSANLFRTDNRIEVVRLQRNRLISLDLKLGVKLAELKEMSIGGNPWECSCLGEIIAYFELKNIKQPECDTVFFDNGESAVCISLGNRCFGNETLADDLRDNFLESLQYLNC